MQGKKALFITLLVLVLVMGGAYVLYGRLSNTVETDSLIAQETTEPAGESEEFSAPGAGEVDEPIQAPDFTVYDAEGNEVHLSDYVGKPVVLNFWASWCGPCKSEMPDFEEAYQDQGDDVQFLMVNLTDGTRETVESASAFIAEQAYTFPVFYDTDISAALAYRAFSIPTTYFIDAEGYAVARGVGALSGEALQQGIDLLLP